MRSAILSLALAISAAVASPAVGQTTFNFATGSPSGSASTSFNFLGSNPALAVNVRAYTFGDAVSPPTLNGTNLSSLTSGATISWSNRGIGVCTENGALGGNGNQDACSEIDTSQSHQGRPSNPTPNEALLLDFTGEGGINISGAVLNQVDTNDTLGIFGVGQTGLLTFLGFGNDPIYNGSSTGLGFSGSYDGNPQSATYRTYTMTFNPILGPYNRYLFTTSTNGNDGYRLQSLTASAAPVTAISAVPEAEIWAMLIAGFGLVGFQMRRTRKLEVVTA